MTKDILEKVSVDKENHEYLVKNYPSGSRFGLMKEVFLGRMNDVSKANWIMLIFCLPLFAVLVYASMLAAKDSVYAPFSSNFGIGYPATDNAQALYDEATFATALTRTCMLLPCIAIAFVGLAGVFNVIKYHMLGANVKVWKEFFKGVKNNWFVHLWIGAIAALAYFLLEMSICGFGVPSFPLGWKIALIVISSLIILTVLTFAMFIITQSALYYLPMGKMIKNAALFVRSFPLQNLLIMIASSIPAVLLMIMGDSFFLQILVIMICSMLGFSYIACVWTDYTHFVYYNIFTAAIENSTGKGKKKRAK